MKHTHPTPRPLRSFCPQQQLKRIQKRRGPVKRGCPAVAAAVAAGAALLLQLLLQPGLPCCCSCCCSCASYPYSSRGSSLHMLQSRLSLQHSRSKPACKSRPVCSWSTSISRHAYQAETPTPPSPHALPRDILLQLKQAGPSASHVVPVPLSPGLGFRV